jgi:thioredoxin-related protein
MTMVPRRIMMQNAIISIALCAYSIRANAQKSSKNALLPWPADLRTISQEAQRRGEPLVLMVSLPGCPWCELIRRNYLTPMRAEGVAAYEFMINERSQRIADFKGQQITPAAWSEAMKVNITPTLLFFNAQGQEIAPRIEGVASADFIGAILNEHLTTARKKL